MEIGLALVVVVAVLLFGALISIGNERQKRAIDQLRNQVVLWAVQDLQIKREKLVRDVRMEDPQAWLNKIISQACGYDLQLQRVEFFPDPQALLCRSADMKSTVVLTALSPAELKRAGKGKRNRLRKFTGQNPVVSLPKNVVNYELSVLNCGILFDLELGLAWKELTGEQLEQCSRLWAFVY
jgi:hypothetical protein